MRLPLRYKLAWRTVRYYWQTNLALAMGIAAATSVIIGSLLIGDSTRSSMSDLVQKRLGTVQTCLSAPSFFRTELADEISDGQTLLNQSERQKRKVSSDGSPDLWAGRPQSESAVRVVPVIQWPGALKATRSGRGQYAGDSDTGSRGSDLGSSGFQPTGFPPIVLWGVDSRFAGLKSEQEPDFPVPGPREAVVNEATAAQFGIRAGDDIVVRISAALDISPETALGRKNDLIEGFRLKVSGIVPDRSLGGISFRPQQRPSLNVFVNLGWLQDKLERKDQANTLLANTAISYNYRPVLTDYGFQIHVSELGYWDISSRRMVLSSQETEALKRRVHELYPKKPIQISETLLAVINEVRFSNNTDRTGKAGISGEWGGTKSSETKGDLGLAISSRLAGGSGQKTDNNAQKGVGVELRKSLPYSILAATNDPNIPALKPGEIAVNCWAARQMGLQPGDTLTFEYYDPDSLDGQSVTRTQDWKVSVVLQDLPLFTDKDWVPEIPGLTDKSTLETWEAPFPFDAKRITPADEQYWTDFKAAPKFYLSLEEGRRFFANRFGSTTSVRVWNAPTPRSSDLAPRPQEVGWTFVPVRQQNLSAAQGATPFELLFLSLSFFVFAAALILISILMRLNIDSRSEQIGVMQAVGWQPGAIRTVFLYEGAIVAVFGTLLGLGGGIGFAAGIIFGLHTFWLGAIGVPFLSLTVTAGSLLYGALCGFVCSFLTIILTLGGFSRLRTVERLHGQFEIPPRLLIRPGYRRALYIGFGLYALLVVSLFGLTLFRFSTPLELVARVFSFSIGLLVLGIVLYGISLRCGFLSGLPFDLRNHVRRPLRGVLSMGLVSLAVFLTVSMGAFRQNPDQLETVLLARNGDYRLFVKTASPVFADLNDPAQRDSWGFTPEEQKWFEQVQIVSLLVRDGDDASCGNLYRPRSPEIIGVPMSFMDNRQFGWSDALIKPEAVFPKNGSNESNSTDSLNVSVRQNGNRFVDSGNRASRDLSRPDTQNPWSALWIKEYAHPLLQKEQIEQEEPDANDPLALNRRKKEHVFSHVLPVIADQNTVTYMLQLPGLNSRILLDDRPGHEVQGRLVGILDNGAFQGKLIADADQLRDFFPEIEGYRMFLVQCPAEALGPVRQTLIEKLEEYGVETETIVERSARLLSVQNTYLYAFEGLGVLGILFGVSGLAAVVLRSLLERRREMALCEAIGYTDDRIRQLVVRENMVPVIAGTANGAAASVVTVIAAGKFSGGVSSIQQVLDMPWVDLLITSAVCIAVAWIACRWAVRSIRFETLVRYLNDES